TNIGENSLSKESLYTINLSTHEKLYSKIGNFNSTTSIFFLFNALYACIFSLNYQQNMRHIMKLNRAVERRTSDNELLNEED
ncbi:MurR/RpiR family transcriptional regulator, partial [Enterococcus faecalis]|nr:MurR/RpiR family transcriptional regulator [Enterococcus faecalis]